MCILLFDYKILVQLNPFETAGNEVQIDIIILGKISIPHWDRKSDSPLCCRDRHYLGSHIVDPFPRTPKPNKSSQN